VYKKRPQELGGSCGVLRIVVCGGSDDPVIAGGRDVRVRGMRRVVHFGVEICVDVRVRYLIVASVDTLLFHRFFHLLLCSRQIPWQVRVFAFVRV